MLAYTHHVSLLYRYLRMLSVKVDRGTVSRLLAHPMGNSMRGLSDALDALGVQNGAYQLPPECFSQLEAPFVAVTHRAEEPFCLVERIEETELTIYARGRQTQIERGAFLRIWTGGILMGEVTENTRQDKYFRIRNFIDGLQRYSLPEAGILGIFILIASSSSVIETLFCLTLYAGLFVSAAILYKETTDSHFLHRLCHIGTVIDCNTVLQSKGSRLAGMNLGELSLFYFGTLLLFALSCPHHYFLPLATCCGLAALLFTIYSIVYQLFIIKKGCMLCMAINLIVWLNCLELYLLRDANACSAPTFTAFLALTLSAAFCMATWQSIKRLLKTEQETAAYRERLSTLFNPQFFNALASCQPHIEQMPEKSICLHNGQTDGEEVLVVTNPTCKNCARIHPSIKELSTRVPISLILQIFPGDKLGRDVALRLIAAWQSDGWEKMIALLEAWNERHDPDVTACYPITEKAECLLKKQIQYATEQQIMQTPSVIIGGRYMPDAYRIEDLKYVLT